MEYLKCGICAYVCFAAYLYRVNQLETTPSDPQPWIRCSLDLNEGSVSQRALNTVEDLTPGTSVPFIFCNPIVSGQVIEFYTNARQGHLCRKVPNSSIGRFRRDLCNSTGCRRHRRTTHGTEFSYWGLQPLFGVHRRYSRHSGQLLYCRE